VIETVREWWRARAPRERQILAAGASALGAAAFWAYVWLPVETGRAQLAETLPRLRLAAQQVARDAAEVDRLSAAARARTGGAPQAAVGEAMARFGQSYAGVTALADGRLQISLKAVAFDALVQVLAELGEAHGLAVESIAIKASGEPGTVRVEQLVLRAGRSG